MTDQQHSPGADQLRKRVEWTGQHRGVHFKISHHGEGDSYRPLGTWCYYVLIPEPQIPEGWLEKFDLEPRVDDTFGKDRITYDYMGAWFADLEWHGGITWYEKKSGLDGKPRVFELGCDYAHYWDEGRMYSVGFVLNDVKRTIDELLRVCPLLVRCNWDGCFGPMEQMTPWGDGYINNGCIEARNAAFPNAEPIEAAT